MKNVVIVIPTYNERENIGSLIEKIEYQIYRISPEYNLLLLIVDDNSPDGTAQIVLNYTNKYKNIFLLKGKKTGIGTAYIRGFKYAIKKLNADVIFEMDADFSHDPDNIPRLLSGIRDGYDIVIGSRYVSGGSIPESWSTLRKLNSKAGNIFARYIIGIHTIKDCTGRYCAIRASLLKKINLDALQVKGYAFQPSLLFHAIKQHASIAEIPIQLRDRIHGASKLQIHDTLEFIQSAFKIRFSFLSSASQFLAIFTLSFIFGLSLFFLSTYKVVTPETFLIGLILLFSSCMILQSSFSLFCMLYAWDNVDKIRRNRAPDVFFQPVYSFTAIIPARHEQHVIADTINAISAINYPDSLKEILIVCRYDDTKTIAKVKETLARLNKSYIRLIIFKDNPINKPHSLNVGLSHATKDVMVVFDAEDQPSKDIYHIANTVIQRDCLSVLQAGVQLMNFRSSWFSTLNVLEYFFWFKSTLHFFTKMGAIPLGGNTVFFKKSLLQNIGGWDEKCLTEDADIGIRASIAGAKIGVVYDEIHTTKEETPVDMKSFIKQRTRWNQGFVQILMKGQWLQLSTRVQRLLAGYILLFPQVQAFFFLLIPLSLLSEVLLKLPIIVTFFSLLPFALLILQMITYNIGLYEFTRSYHLNYNIFMPLRIVFTFFPYQLLLGLSAFRACLRLLKKEYTWEKTLHINAHRQSQETSTATTPIIRGMAIGTYE